MTKQPSEFERESAAKPPGILSEFASFVRHNRKWWLLPILVVILLLAVLVVLGGTGAAPFIYTIF